MSKAIVAVKPSTENGLVAGHPCTPRLIQLTSSKKPIDVQPQSRRLPTRRPPLMIAPHGRLVSSRLTRQSHPDCRATALLQPSRRRSGNQSAACSTAATLQSPTSERSRRSAVEDGRNKDRAYDSLSKAPGSPCATGQRS